MGSFALAICLVFSHRHELDAQTLELVQEIEEVFNRARQPVGGPDDDHFEAAPRGIRHHAIERRPFHARAAETMIDVLLDHFEPVGGGHSF